ncbi:MAG: heavy-metal-associated domain-containing protein [Marinobacter sp.]|uniref:heavy-metal-associated domain-containing protein n=1 Tax=Marinobacter sp. TaxID=50741 RepID=UPI00299F1825|nr:heavy-metal-associated domain-containing protein [Marinobacter sp.]MDX1755539.1 heavy-metal-associated domain-containing protein [Marinobacter sp.]
MLQISAVLAGPRYTLGVQGLACPYCSYGIEKRLYQIGGVESIQVDIALGRVRVTLADGEHLSEARARQAVKEAGFTLESFTQLDDGSGGDDEQ